MRSRTRFGSIGKAMWWAVVTLSTTGYGDAIPQSLAGRVLAGLVMMCGIGVFALWAGILATGFAEEVRRLDFVNKWQLVSAVPLFRQLGAAELGGIVRALRPRNLPAGAIICRKGESGDQMFFIVEGRVNVAAAAPVELGAGRVLRRDGADHRRAADSDGHRDVCGHAAVAACPRFPDPAQPQSSDRRDDPQHRCRARQRQPQVLTKMPTLHLSRRSVLAGMVGFAMLGGRAARAFPATDVTFLFINDVHACRTRDGLSPNCEEEGKTDENLLRHVRAINRIEEAIWPVGDRRRRDRAALGRREGGAAARHRASAAT